MTVTGRREDGTGPHRAPGSSTCPCLGGSVRSTVPASAFLSVAGDVWQFYETRWSPKKAVRRDGGKESLWKAQAHGQRAPRPRHLHGRPERSTPSCVDSGRELEGHRRAVHLPVCLGEDTLELAFRLHASCPSCQRPSEAVDVIAVITLSKQREETET